MIEIVPYDLRWPEEFAVIAAVLRRPYWLDLRAGSGGLDYRRPQEAACYAEAKCRLALGSIRCLTGPKP